MKRTSIMIAFLFAFQVNSGFAQTKTSANKVLSAYFDLKNALAKDNGTLAKKSASLLEQQISSVDFKDAASADQLLLKKATMMAQSSAKEIGNTTDISEQRKTFKTLSAAMITLVKDTKPGDKPIFVQYWPMAKASWLNENKTIENPYYGKSMAACGTVKEVLNEK